MTAPLTLATTNSAETANKTDEPRATEKPATGRFTFQERVRTLMDRAGKSQKDLAEETGLSPSVISQWLGGKYEHAGDVVPAMQAWIARQTHGRADFEFLMIRNAARVFDACEFALQQRRISLVVGRPGLGKTVALSEFHRKTILGGQEVLYHFVSPAIKQHSLAKMLAARFELSGKGTTYDLLEGVVTRLRRRPVPLLFDESNHFNVPCLEVIRYLYDSVEVPIVLCGSIQLQRTLSEASDRHIELEQLQSRIGLRVVLEPMKVEDVRDFLATQFATLSKDVVREFFDKSRGVVRDLVNILDKVRAIMKRNKLPDPTTEAVRVAAEYQFRN